MKNFLATLFLTVAALTTLPVLADTTLEQGPFSAQEDWECTTENTGKTQTLDNGFTYCDGSGDWACFFIVKEICEERSSGSTRTSTSKEFRFCTRTLSECF